MNTMEAQLQIPDGFFQLKSELPAEMNDFTVSVKLQAGQPDISWTRLEAPTAKEINFLREIHPNIIVIRKS